jgi:glucan biosynthesis protein C
MNAGVRQRVYFLDNLRAFIILLIIFFHVAMGYTTWDLKWWYVNDSQKSALFDLFVLATDVYIMPLMFFIAGYFTLPALLRQGPARFWRGKLWRIVGPWVAGVLFVAPAIAYSAVFSRTDRPPAYLEFWANDFFGAYYQQAHYWFLGVLALFFLLFTVACMLRPTLLIDPPRKEMPPAAFFPTFVLLSAGPFFALNLFFWSDAWVNCRYVFMIQPVRVGLYLCYFGLGVYAWKRAWFTANGWRPRLETWGSSAVVLLLLFLAYRLAFTLNVNTPVLFKAGHALAYAGFCLAATMALIALFQRVADSDAYLWRRLAANSYTIYFIHQCVIIPLAYMVRNSQLNIWIKYLTVAAAAAGLCFIVAEYVVRPLLASVDRGRKVAG